MLAFLQFTASIHVIRHLHSLHHAVCSAYVHVPTPMPTHRSIHTSTHNNYPSVRTHSYTSPWLGTSPTAPIPIPLSQYTLNYYCEYYNDEQSPAKTASRSLQRTRTYRRGNAYLIQCKPHKPSIPRCLCSSNQAW